VSAGITPPHSPTSDDEGKMFDTDEIATRRSSKSVAFEREGEFKYYCKVHGKAMRGTIVVTAREK
jgi:plastocyanin